MPAGLRGRAIKENVDMDELISRNESKRLLQSWREENGMSLREEQCNKVCRILDDVLANRPTERDSLIVATRNAFKALEEPKTGKWVDDGDPLMFTCGNCGYGVMRYNNTPFCPNCGADMREVTT